MKCGHRQIFIILLLLSIHIFVTQGAPGPKPGEKKERAKKWFDDAVSKGRDILRGDDDNDSSSSEESDEVSSYPEFKTMLIYIVLGLGILIVLATCCLCVCCKYYCCPPEAQLTAKPYTPRNSTQAVTTMPWNQNQEPGTSQSQPMMMKNGDFEW